MKSYNLFQVTFDDSGVFENIEPSKFIIYQVDPETGTVIDIQNVVYPME